MKKPPPLAHDLVVLLDEGKREIGEFVINNFVEFYSFMIAINKAADDAFEISRTMQ